MSQVTRRGFIAAAGLAALARRGQAADPPAAWEQQADAILARIKPPSFPKRDFEITRYGAKADGQADCSEAFRKAIDACTAAGGGRVVVPGGTFLTGALHLKSNVNLHLADNAVVRFSTDPKLYPVVLTRFEGTECMNYSPFIYAFEQTNLAITGAGTLDGQASCDHWWNWVGRGMCGSSSGISQRADRDALVAMGEKDVPVKDRVFGAGHYLRPNFIQPYRSKNILIEGVKIRNSPMWEINPVLCRNVTVRNVDVATHGPNNDGCDPESCTDVLIQGCTFDTGDDCIAIKSGRNRDGRRVNVPCENLVIERCVMKDGHGGVTIGSEASGGVRNVFARDCRMSSPNLDRALRLKTNSYRGGFIENVSFRNITVGQVAREIVQIDLFYEEGEGGPFPPAVRNIAVRDVTCEKAPVALSLRGYASMPIRNVALSHCRFIQVDKPNVIEHVEGLRIDDVLINGAPAKT